MIQWATILLEGLLLKALSQIKRMRPNWIHWPGLNQPVPRHDFHKVVDLHQLFMVPDEGIIHPNVEHHILSRFFLKIPRFRSEIWLFNGENQKIIEKLPYYAILSFCWRHHHSKSGVVLIIDRGYPKLSHQSNHRKRVAAQAMDRHTIPTDSPAASVTIWSTWSSSKSHASEMNLQVSGQKCQKTPPERKLEPKG